MNEECIIRALMAGDDFEEIRQLVSRTYNRLNPTAYWGGQAEDIKKNLETGTGFVAVENDKIVGFAGIQLSVDTSSSGFICGFEESYIHKLNVLIAHCCMAAQNKGVKKIVAHIVLKFGQVRNRMISILESQGFVSEEYLTSSFNMDLLHWDAPTEFNNERIEPAVDLQIREIQQMLTDDGENDLAKRFSTQFTIHPNYTRHTPDYVFLILRDKDSNAIAGVSYYRVQVFKNDEVKTYIATSCGFHFRPQYKLDRREKRRFIQGTYLSMKQLGIRRAVSQMTFHQYDVFAAIAAEGYDSITSSSNALLMTKHL